MRLLLSVIIGLVLGVSVHGAAGSQEPPPYTLVSSNATLTFITNTIDRILDLTAVVPASTNSGNWVAVSTNSATMNGTGGTAKSPFMRSDTNFVGVLITTNGPVINVLAYGADNDYWTTTNDSTAAIQAAIDTVPMPANPLDNAAGGIVLIPAGNYGVKGPIFLHEGVVIKGSGINNTILRQTTTNVDCFVFTATNTSILNKIAISDLSINQDGQVPSTNGAGIHITASGGAFTMPFIQNVYIYITYNGMLLDNLIGGVIDNCVIQDTAGIGILGKTPINATSFRSTYVATSGHFSGLVSDNWHLTGNYITLINCASDGASGCGYYLDGVQNSSLVSCGSEQNSVHLFMLTNCVNVNMSGYGIARHATIDGIRIDGGRGIHIDNVRIDSAGTTPSGYNLSLTNQSGAYPQQVVLTGSELASNFSSGQINDPAHILIQVGDPNNRMSIGAGTAADALHVWGNGRFENVMTNQVNVNLKNGTNVWTFHVEPTDNTFRIQNNGTDVAVYKPNSAVGSGINGTFYVLDRTTLGSTTVDTRAALFIQNSGKGDGANYSGVQSAPTLTNTITSTFQAYTATPVVNANTPEVVGFRIGDPTGTGVATNAVGMLFPDIAFGKTNAIFRGGTINPLATGPWFWYYDGAYPSYIGASWEVRSNLTANAGAATNDWSVGTLSQGATTILTAGQHLTNIADIGSGSGVAMTLSGTNVSVIGSVTADTVDATNGIKSAGTSYIGFGSGAINLTGRMAVTHITNLSDLASTTAIAMDLSGTNVSAIGGITADNVHATNGFVGEAGGLTEALAPTNSTQLATKAYVDAAIPSSFTYYFYGSSNATTLSGLVQPLRSTNWAYPSPASLTANTNTITSATNATYIAAYVTADTFRQLSSGNVNMDIYASFNTGAGRTAAIHPEIYLYDTVGNSNIIEFPNAPPDQSISGTLALYSFSVAITNFTWTNPFRVICKVKAATVNLPDISLVTQSNFTSHIDFNVPGGTFVQKAGDTMTGPLAGTSASFTTSVTSGNFVFKQVSLTQGVSPLADSTNQVLDFSQGMYQIWALTNDVCFTNFTGSSSAATIKFRPNGANRNVLIDTNWMPVNVQGGTLNGSHYQFVVTNGTTFSVLSAWASGANATNVAAVWANF